MTYVTGTRTRTGGRGSLVRCFTGNVVCVSSRISSYFASKYVLPSITVFPTVLGAFVFSHLLSTFSSSVFPHAFVVCSLAVFLRRFPSSCGLDTTFPVKRGVRMLSCDGSRPNYTEFPVNERRLPPWWSFRLFPYSAFGQDCFRPGLFSVRGCF